MRAKSIVGFFIGLTAVGLIVAWQGLATVIDLLAEAGYSYHLDWCHDDQPTWFECRDGRRILSVPYQQEINDIPHTVARQ